MLGPVIEGERIRMEPRRPEYLPAYVRWFADMEVTQYLLFRYPLTEKGEAEWLEQTAKDQSNVLWAIGPTGVTCSSTDNAETSGSGRSCGTTGKPRRGTHEAAAAGDAL